MITEGTSEKFVRGCEIIAAEIYATDDNGPLALGSSGAWPSKRSAPLAPALILYDSLLQDNYERKDSTIPPHLLPNLQPSPPPQ